MQPTVVIAEQDGEQRKLRGRPWPPGTSGNPNGRRSMSKRAAMLFEALAADFGGVDALTAIDRALLEQGCRLLVRAEREKSADAAVRLSSEARRALVALRRRRETAPRKETLGEYLASKHAAGAGG